MAAHDIRPRLRLVSGPLPSGRPPLAPKIDNQPAPRRPNYGDKGLLQAKKAKKEAKLREKQAALPPASPSPPTGTIAGVPSAAVLAEHLAPIVPVPIAAAPVIAPGAPWKESGSVAGGVLQQPERQQTPAGKKTRGWSDAIVSECLSVSSLLVWAALQVPIYAYVVATH